VQHEAPEGIALERLDLLLVVLGAEGGDDEGLGLPAGEERRAVGARQVRHLAPDRAHFLDAAAVHADAFLHDEPAHLGLLDLLEVAAGLRPVRLVAADGREHLLEDGVEGLATRLLLVHGQRLDHLGRGQLLHARLERRIGARLGVEGPAGLGRLGHQLLLDPGQLLAPLVAEGQRLEHLLLADFLAAGLDHQDGVLITRHHELERGGRHLLVGGIGHQLAVDQGHPDRPDRTRERDAGQRHRGRGADHREHVRVVVGVRRDDQVDDLDLVAEALGEEGTERPVDEPAGQRLLLVGPALALEEAAGDAATRVGLLAVLDGEGQEVPALEGGPRGDGGREHHGPAAADDHGPVGLLGDLSGLDGERQVVDLDLHRMRCHTVSILLG
jgi:hypothetical protein